MREGLDLPDFGNLPFDHFVVVNHPSRSSPHIYESNSNLISLFIKANWDTTSPLSKNEQKRILVEKWIALGKYGRNDWALAMFNDPLIDHIPEGIPQDLLSEEDRAISSLMSTTLWIRTWFGDHTDQTSQDAADTAYARLRKEVLQQGHEDHHVFCIPEEHVFEDPEDLMIDARWDRDLIEGVATGCPGSVPGYLLAALMHCPELFEGVSDDDWRHWKGEERAEELVESDRIQKALVLVADRKACVEGWVLALAVNHRGEVLPVRVRGRAMEVAQIAVDWLEGEPLSDIVDDGDEDVEFYLGGGNGWE
ncbi:uncharacterized protein N7511_007344 [Penicillium nucicola]|uniref:uncharacterized protein n=1 Tax=Penicillium nucicola TaxID=1850975 RepID=UPI00254552CC|nr:uncharacterized protein N7511_007344 [Penicillium nucicola]KAJ5757162.1 hypothetical protein N7511_007344 [Penicillium nucicola]